ncbi:MAG: ABC transporter permease [Candidatus Thorarchaeota archaeon]|nr:MAG: ABC transporter permease [Candidatus Thorarchaeota archaeon]
MAAVPAGYEAFHSLRRKSITLICFLLASTMAIGITVYVDSFSVHEWDKNIDVGCVAITVSGYNVRTYVDDIQNIGGVTNAALLRSSYGDIFLNDSETGYLDIGGRFIAPDDEFYEAFPDFVHFDVGRSPVAPDEIAVINSFYLFEDVKLGDDYTLDISGHEYNVTVVGFYNHEEDVDSPYVWGYYSTAIVNQSLIDNDNADFEILVDVDRSGLSAFNPTGTLQYLNGIDEAIRQLDPNYSPGYYDMRTLYVQNRLSSGVTAYIIWVQMMRITEMLRVSSIFFLLILVNYLAIRHNVNERRYEESMLISRGAAKGDLEKVTTREIFILSLLSCIVGIPLGLLLSRVAISSTGFFTFNPALLLSEPILISLDSLVISLIVTVALPMLTLGGYRAVYSTKKNIDEDRGRLSKLSRGLGLIRWDLMIVGLSGLFLFAMIAGGTTATSNILLGFILPFLPIPLFLGVSSLSMKALKWGANGLSRAMRRVVGDIPASIGIRRVGKGASSAGAAAMILVLAICLSWNSAIIDASMPITAQNQSRLAVGSDLTFALDKNELDSWDQFITNVTNHELVESGTVVSEAYLFLSAGYEGGTDFLAVNPREYKNVGYDYLGNPLNESDLSTLFDSLDSTPDGAIITRDIAEAYEFEVGDILRASSLEEGASPFTFRIIGISEALPEVPDRGGYYPFYYDPFYSSYYYTPSVVGKDRILVNRDYLGSQLTLQNNSFNYLCVRTTPNTNASIIVEDVLEAGGGIALYNNLWEAVSQNVHEYIDATQYKMERSLDTMLTILTVGTIVGGFAIYAVEGIRTRKREIALLRSIGASSKTIVMTLGAEMFVLMLFSMMLLLIYAPLFLSTTITMAGGSTTGGYEVFPVPIFPVIPWNTIFVVLGFFVVSVALFIFVIAVLSSRINLASTLNAAWAEAGPYGGDV